MKELLPQIFKQACQNGFKTIVQEVEEQLILLAMKATGGNCNQAAKLLKMNRTTLVMKRRKYGLIEKATQDE